MDIPAEVVDQVTDHVARRRVAKTLPQKLREAIRDLDTFPNAYADGLDALRDSQNVALIRSSTAGFIRSSGKPESRPPSGADRALRANLVRSTQRLMAADRELMTWDWDIHAWEPAELVYTTTDGLVMCNGDGSVCWRDADDETTGLLGWQVVAGESKRLRGMLSALQSYDWPDDDQDFDAAVLIQVLRHVGSAVSALRWAGVWEVPRLVVECGHCGAQPKRLHSVNPPRCSACSEYFRRTGLERPRHLWRGAA